jgi:hypothetical protein
VNPARNLVASGGSDGSIRVWSTLTGTAGESMLRHPTGPVSALALSPDGAWLVSAGPSSARIWALASGTAVNEIEVDGTPLAVAFAPGSSLAAVGDSAGNIIFARPGSSDLRAVRSQSAVTALGFSADASHLASGGRDGTLMLWDTSTAAPIGAPRHFSDPVRWLQWLDEGAPVAVVSGSWLHLVEQVDAAATAVTGSRLLPEALRGAETFSRLGDGRIFGMALAGRGMLDQAVLDPAVPPVADTTLPERDWSRVLGLRLDTETGAITAPDP